MTPTPAPPPPRPRRLLAFLAPLAPLVLGGCLNFNYVYRSIDEPIDGAVIERLAPDRDDLAACLARLGAPRYVWELPNDGCALAYGWSSHADWGFSVSWSPRELSYGGPSFEFDSTDETFFGVVLMFDGQLLLRAVRRGYLRDIAADLVRRPGDPVDG